MALIDPNNPPVPTPDKDQQVATYAKLLRTVPFPGAIRTVMTGPEAGTYTYNQPKGAWTALQPMDTLPLGSVYSPMGDSITAYGVNTGNPYYNSDGFTTWVNLYTGGKFYTPPGGNQGVGGNTTTQMVTRLAAALAYRPAVTSLLGGTNDITAGTPATTIIGNLNLILQAYRALNTRVVLITILPRFGGFVLTSGQEVIRQTVNTWILSQATEGVAVVNGEVLNNATYFQDGLHPNSQGASILGKLVAGKLLDWVNPANFTRNLVQSTSLTNNVDFTGGTTTATSWSLGTGNAGGATAVASKTTDGNLNQQVVTLSGTYTGTNKYVGLFNNTATTTPQAGQLTESRLDFSFTGTLTGISGVSISTTYDGAGGYISDSYSFFPNDALPFAATPGRYQIRGVPFLVPSGVTSVETNVIIHLITSGGTSPVSGVIKIHRAGVSLVNTNPGTFEYDGLNLYYTTGTTRKAVTLT